MTDTGRDALERVLDDAKQHYPDDSGWWRPGDIPTVRDWVASLVKRAEDAEAQVARLNHCADCCCARAWEALGNPQYDGRTIPEHIATLKSQLARLSRLEAAARQSVKNATHTDDRAICAACWAHDALIAAVAALDELEAK